MSFLNVTDDGLLQVTYDPFLLPPDEVFILASPDTHKWQVTVSGGAGFIQVRDDTGPYPAATRRIFNTPLGSHYELLVTNAGILQLSQFASSLVFSPVGNSQIKLDNGALAAGYKLFTYVADSQVLTTVFQNSDFSQPHANPIILNSLGMPPSPIFIEMGKAYRFILAPSDQVDFPAVFILEWGGVKGGADINRNSPIEFLADTTSAVGVSASSFTVAGDARRLFTVGRRVRCEALGVLITYGVIALAVYDGVTTTVTIVVDVDPVTTNPNLVVRVSILTAQESAIPSRRLIGLNTILRGGLNLGKLNVIPAGLMMYYPIEQVPPLHWLRCDGGYYLNTDYPDLYAAIGITYGSPGAGSFKVPNINGLMLIGVTTMGSTPDPGRVTVASHNGNQAGIIGGVGGIEAWQLSVDEMAYHSHGRTLSEGVLQNSDEAGATNTTSVKRSDFGSGLTAAGGDGLHNNMPPYLACNVIIHT